MFAAPFPKKKDMFSTPQPLKLVKPEWSSSGKLKSKSLYSSPMKTPSTPCKRKDSGPLIHFIFLNKENLHSVLNSGPLKSVLGQGTFGKVFHVVENSTQKEYAIKKVHTPFSGINSIKRFQELEILWQLDRSIACVRLFNAWIQDGFLYMQMELCSGGNLLDYLEKRGRDGGVEEELDIYNLIQKGLRDIHALNIVHLDLKPGNIFIDSAGKLKIGDFGHAAKCPVINPEEHEGDRTYLAPEFWTNHPVGTEADIFSLGLIALEAAANIVLPENGSQWSALRESDFSIVEFGNTSIALIDLISSMLIPDAQKRPTASNILTHPLIQNLS